MDIDAIFSEVGDLGPQQRIYVVIINIVHLYLAVNVFSYPIVASNVDFYCVTNRDLSLPTNCKSLIGKKTAMFPFLESILNVLKVEQVLISCTC